MLGGAALVSGVVVKFSYVARELVAAFFGLGIVYAAVLLIVGLCYLVFRGAAWVFSWVGMQSQQWNRVSGEWVYAFSQPRPAIAKPISRIS
jgi:hypothetical protein